MDFEEGGKSVEGELQALNWGKSFSVKIGKNTLDKQHEETKTGLEVAKQKKLERDAERAERRRKRASKSSLPLEDTEAQADGAPAAEPAANKEKHA